MFKAIKTYFRMIANKWKVEAYVYGAAAKFIADRESILGFVNKLFEALKDVNPEEMQEMFVKELSSIVHEEGEKQA